MNFLKEWEWLPATTGSWVGWVDPPQAEKPNIKVALAAALIWIGSHGGLVYFLKLNS